MPSKPPRTDWLPNNPDKETLLNWVNSSPDKVVLQKARDGDWELLALYLEGGEPVTPDIRKFLSEVLRGDRKRPKNRHSLASTVAREMEIAEFVMKQEDAGKRRGVIAEAEEKFRCSRSTVQRALKKHRIAERIARGSGGKVWFRHADNTRVPARGAMGGWDMMRARLVGNSDGLPMLVVFSTCIDFIRTVPFLQHDPDRTEDVMTDSEDHCGDEARYACMSRPWVATKEAPKPENSSGYRLYRMDAQPGDWLTY